MPLISQRSPHTSAYPWGHPGVGCGCRHRAERGVAGAGKAGAEEGKTQGSLDLVSVAGIYTDKLLLLVSCSIISDSCDPMDCSPPGSSVLGFSRQEYRSGLPCPPPGDLPTQESNLCPLRLLHWQAGSFPLFPSSSLLTQAAGMTLLGLHGKC